MSREAVRAFAPGRVNLIGEHTDYNGGLALPFAIEEGIAVAGDPRGVRSVEAIALDLDGERDEFPLRDPPRAHGWRAYVRGVVDELARAGFALRGARLRFGGDLPIGSGLSSSAALEVSVALALVELAGGAIADRVELARLCARVESEWVGAQTGLLDQLASLCGAREHALLIDFAAVSVLPVRLRLGAWRLAVLDSGERHANASSGYNERRAECAQACRLLGVRHLSEAQDVEPLPQPLRLRAEHVLGENARVRAAVAALADDDLAALGPLLDASHASLRDLYEASTPAVERALDAMRAAGASGARLVGGGFGGSVLGLFAPGVAPPAHAREVRPGPGAHVS